MNPGETTANQRFDQLFDSFAAEAFRLETLPSYNTPDDVHTQARYAAGEPLPDPPQPTEWTRFIAEQTSLGRRMPHVRLVTEPLTLYLRCAMDWFFPAQAAAGREIYVVGPGSSLADEATATGDFWLFDHSVVALLSYDPHGAFTSVSVHEDPETVARYLNLRARLLDTAVPFRSWLAAWRERVR